MIKANELRVGNWIMLHKPNEEPRPYDICAHDIEEIEGYGEDCFPVPITEDWLKRFGFRCDSIPGDNKWLTITLCRKTVLDADESTNFSYVDFRSSGQMISKCRYIHQLQNLYFALTGTELSLAPPIDYKQKQ